MATSTFVNIPSVTLSLVLNELMACREAGKDGQDLGERQDSGEGGSGEGEFSSQMLRKKWA